MPISLHVISSISSGHAQVRPPFGVGKQRYLQPPLFLKHALVAVKSIRDTVKILRIGTPEIITIIVLQLEQLDFYSAVLCSKDADRITNREDPDQTAP